MYIFRCWNDVGQSSVYCAPERRNIFYSKAINKKLLLGLIDVRRCAAIMCVIASFCQFIKGVIQVYNRNFIYVWKSVQIKTSVRRALEEHTSESGTKIAGHYLNMFRSKCPLISLVSQITIIWSPNNCNSAGLGSETIKGCR